MSMPESRQGGPGVAEIMRLTFGPEFDYYKEQLQSIPPEKFAVIKVGGATVRDDLDRLADDIAALSQLGLYPVIVHGGGPQIDADLKERAIPEEKKDGVRITDETTLESVERGLSTVNDTLVEALRTRGVSATGIKSGVFTAELKDGGDFGRVGEVTSIKGEVIDAAIAERSVPIVSCLGADENGELLNINGDTSAAALALERQPHRYIVLSDVPGVLDDNQQLISVINDPVVAEDMMAQHIISGGMALKVRNNLRILEQLPDNSSIVFTQPSTLLKELFTHRGAGTLLRHGDAISHLPSKDAVDQQEVRNLIEAAFGKRLVDDYFDELPTETEIFITDRGYRGLAIVLPGEDNGIHKQPAYMDKLVVREEEGGHGIGDEIVRAVLKEHPEGLYWRVRKDNKSLLWYRSRGLGQEYDYDDEWIVFFTREIKQENRPLLAATAVLREQTVVPHAV